MALSGAPLIFPSIDIATSPWSAARVDAFGPGQIIEFHGSVDTETQAMQARRAFEVMQQFLSYL
jgi:hypothetical protein